MPRMKDPNAKRNRMPSAFRLDPDLMDRVRIFCQSHHLAPTHTGVVEAALREFLDRHEPTVIQTGKSA